MRNLWIKNKRLILNLCLAGAAIILLAATFNIPKLSSSAVSGMAQAAHKVASVVAPRAVAQDPAPQREKPAKITNRGIYLTAYSAGSAKKVDSIIANIKGTQINSVVIDIKDYTGYLDYDSQIPLVKELGLKQIKIKDIKGVVDKFHKAGFYIIARVAVFQDPVLAVKKPHWAVHNNSTHKIWQDSKGLSWVDPDNQEVWQYHVDIAKEAIGLGFDEVNFDYVRFPSDGAMSVMTFPYWQNSTSTPKAAVIKSFFSYLHDNLKDEPGYISIDLFGLATVVTKGDMNIGQVLENAAPYFDYICPMVYPSHYPSGYLNYKNPADHPYEIISQALSTANARLASTTDSLAQIRPWLQDFDLGAVYTADMIKKEIKAGSDNHGDGYLIWDPKNLYTWAAFK